MDDKPCWVYPRKKKAAVNKHMMMSPAGLVALDVALLILLLLLLPDAAKPSVLLSIDDGGEDREGAMWENRVPNRALCSRGEFSPEREKKGEQGEKRHGGYRGNQRAECINIFFF